MAGKLSPHQHRVLAALLALEREHLCAWWSRDAIGSVVAAGGYHNTLQMGTVAKLKQFGLIQTERSTWPNETHQRVRCTCACHFWGLTVAGREFADSLQIHWPEDALERVKHAGTEAHVFDKLDEDDSQKELKRRWQQREDEEDGDGWKHD